MTVYMAVDKNTKNEQQTGWLLLASILTSLTVILRFDKIGGCYAQAMRILETEILNYLADEHAGYQILIDANKRAEQCIEDKFF